MTEHHGDRCPGLPIFEEDGSGQFTARCANGDFAVTGCETQREAGARFYGGNDPNLYGVPTAPFVTVSFMTDRHSTSMVTADGAELFTLVATSDRRIGITTVYTKARLPGGHDRTVESEDRAKGVAASKRHALTDLTDWFKLRCGLDVIVIDETPDEA